LNNSQSLLSSFFSSLKPNGWITIAYSFIANLIFLTFLLMTGLTFIISTLSSSAAISSSKVLSAITLTSGAFSLVILILSLVISIFVPWFIYSATLNTYKNHLFTGDRGSYIKNGFKGMMTVLSGLVGYIIMLIFFTYSVKIIFGGLDYVYNHQYTTLSNIIIVILTSFFHSYCLPYIAFRMFTKKYFKPHSLFIKRNFLSVLIAAFIFWIISFLPFASILTTIFGYLYIFYIMHYYVKYSGIKNS
jgi:hypothetical protein